MPDWPDAEELKQVLDITSSDFDETIDRVLASAIQHVKDDVGRWDEYEDEPTENMAQAALRMAELISLRPEVAPAAISDPTYDLLLKGQRRAFGIA
jgi:hypothetical protein